MPRPSRSQVRRWVWSGISTPSTFSCLAGLLLGLAPSIVLGSPVPVATFRSEAGEGLDSFALRIAPEAIRLSMGLPAEICGEFHLESSRYVINLYTVRKLKECSYKRQRGNNYTGMTYHTHIVIGETDQRKREAMLRNPRFSDHDYAHPGYMAMGDKVLHQVGRGTERRVR